MGRYIGSYIDGGGHPHQHLPSHPLTTPRGFIYTHKEPHVLPVSILCLYTPLHTSYTGGKKKKPSISGSPSKHDSKGPPTLTEQARPAR